MVTVRILRTKKVINKNVLIKIKTKLEIMKNPLQHKISVELITIITATTTAKIIYLRVYSIL